MNFNAISAGIERPAALARNTREKEIAASGPAIKSPATVPIMWK
jgi:hypothetical protein